MSLSALTDSISPIGLPAGNWRPTCGKSMNLGPSGLERKEGVDGDLLAPALSRRTHSCVLVKQLLRLLI
jgi:hypothetical protein